MSEAAKIEADAWRMLDALLEAVADATASMPKDASVELLYEEIAKHFRGSGFPNWTAEMAQELVEFGQWASPEPRLREFPLEAAWYARKDANDNYDYAFALLSQDGYIDRVKMEFFPPLPLDGRRRR